MADTTNLRCGAVGTVQSAVLAPRCDFLSWLYGPRNEVALCDLRNGGSKIVKSAWSSSVRTIAFRSFIRNGDTMERGTELLYAAARSNQIHRFDAQLGVKKDTLVLGAAGFDTTALAASHDGRYLAAGNQVGEMKVFNFDFPSVKTVSSGRVSQGGIWALAFDRHNLRLYIATGRGELFELDRTRDELTQLNGSRRWLCFSIACHPIHEGVVFSGEGGRLWLVNFPSGIGSMPDPGTTPFAIKKGRNVGGGEIWYMSGMPNGRLRYFDTTLKGQIRQVSFSTTGELIVVGEREVEVWDLANSKLVSTSSPHKSLLIHSYAAARHNGETFVAWDAAS